MSALVVGRLVYWGAATGAAVLVAPAVPPLDPTVNGAGNALAVGCLAGGAAFAVLARKRVDAGAISKLPRRRLLARSVVLAAKSAQEEAIWRGVVLGVLVGPTGRLGAVALSTLLFAAAHVRRLRRSALAHLITGASFGLVYATTGRLHAAIAAHGTYNVLVGAAAMTEQDLSVLDTGRKDARRLRSARSESSRPMHVERVENVAETVARLEGVVKSFPTVRALDGVDLELRRGEIVALLGPNGAGKSTAVAVMLGLRRPDAGRARLFGRDPREPTARRAVGAVLQEIGYPPGLRVRETVELVRAHYADPVETDDVLCRIGLADVAHRDAGGLSGGQRRRLAVALALAGSPDALFLDEPTAAMDVTARRALLRDIAGFAGAGGAVLLTTQHLAEAEEIATRVVLLAHGRVVLEGSVAEVRAHGGRTKVTFRADDLAPLDGPVAVSSSGDRHVVYVDDADSFVARLVRSGIVFRELEVAPVSLEDAFVALTEEGAP